VWEGGVSKDTYVCGLLLAFGARNRHSWSGHVLLVAALTSSSQFPLLPLSCMVAPVPPFPSLLQSLFDHIPVGVGSQGIIPTTAKDLEAALEMGMDWSLR